LKRRCRARRSPLLRYSDSEDNAGILDVLANLVGVLTLVGALSAIIVGQSTVKLRIPLARVSDKSFMLLQVSEVGIWNLEPARTYLTEAQQIRYQVALDCLTDSKKSISECRLLADSYSHQIDVGSASVTTTALNLSLQRHPQPDLNQSDLQNTKLIVSLIQSARDQGKDIFVLLEPDGFATYQLIRTQAAKIGVSVGWEPWDVNKPVIFGNGRAMTIQ